MKIVESSDGSVLAESAALPASDNITNGDGAYQFLPDAKLAQSSLGVTKRPFLICAEERRDSSMNILGYCRENGITPVVGHLLIVGQQTASVTTKDGEAWLNGPKDLCMTVILSDHEEFRFHKLTQMAANLATIDVIRELIATNQPEISPGSVYFKFPNDVWVDHGGNQKKISGALLVGRWEPEYLGIMENRGFDLPTKDQNLALLGIGVNGGLEIEEAKFLIPPISIERLIGRAVPKEQVAAKILERLDHHLAILETDPAEFCASIAKYLSTERSSKVLAVTLDGTKYIGRVVEVGSELVTFMSQGMNVQIPWLELVKYRSATPSDEAT